MKIVPTPLTPVLAALALAGALAVPAVAQDVPDADGNGTWSLEELQAVYADLTEDTFKLIDANADGAVDADELAAAQAAGTLAAG